MEIWTEGCADQGVNIDAAYHGRYPGDSLREAVENWAKQDPAINEHLDLEKLTYCGRRLFNNKHDACGWILWLTQGDKT